MSRKTHHVVSSSSGGWNVKKGGSDRASAHRETKVEAVKVARDISRNQHSELVIHNKDAKISRSDSHGKDPFPPKG